MRDTKNKLIAGSHDQSSTTTTDDYRERLDRGELERLWQLEALDKLLNESEDSPEKFHQQWVKPLLDAGVSLEATFSLLVGGRFRPN